MDDGRCRKFPILLNWKQNHQWDKKTEEPKKPSFWWLRKKARRYWKRWIWSLHLYQGYESIKFNSHFSSNFCLKATSKLLTVHPSLTKIRTFSQKTKVKFAKGVRSYHHPSLFLVWLVLTFVLCLSVQLFVEVWCLCLIVVELIWVFVELCSIVCWVCLRVSFHFESGLWLSSVCLFSPLCFCFIPHHQFFILIHTFSKQMWHQQTDSKIVLMWEMIAPTEVKNHWARVPTNQPISQYLAAINQNINNNRCESATATQSALWKRFTFNKPKRTRGQK